MGRVPAENSGENRRQPEADDPLAPEEELASEEEETGNVEEQCSKPVQELLLVFVLASILMLCHIRLMQVWRPHRLQERD